MLIKKLIALVLTVLPLCLPLCHPLTSGPRTEARIQELDQVTLDRISVLVDSFIEAGYVVGAELLIIKDSRTVLHRACGARDIEAQLPMERGTLFNIRSMAKPIVGSIAMRLVDRGIISLDDHVSLYLPSFAGGLSNGITIEHLLTHRSGLPDGNPAGRPADYPTLRSIADYWGGHGPTEFSPGEGFLYSDPGADVLGAVLESVTGLPLHELAAREVFEPLGMNSTTALLDDAFIGSHHFSSLYQPDGQGAWQRVWSPDRGSIAPFTIGSGTTWYSTPEDYARLLTAWQNEGLVGGEQWLSRESVQQALTPRSVMPYASQIPECEVRYGQMWQIYVRTNEAEQGERAAFGHSGSDGTYSWVWPEHGLVVLYFTQSRGQRTRLLLEPYLEKLALNR
ncbi:serine hydrolase domain-containing protein [Gemmatimonadota bacterium]